MILRSKKVSVHLEYWKIIFYTPYCSSKSAGVQEVVAIISFTFSQSPTSIALKTLFDAISIGRLLQKRFDVNTLNPVYLCSDYIFNLHDGYI